MPSHTIQQMREREFHSLFKSDRVRNDVLYVRIGKGVWYVRIDKDLWYVRIGIDLWYKVA